MVTIYNHTFQAKSMSLFLQLFLHVNYKIIIKGKEQGFKIILLSTYGINNTYWLEPKVRSQCFHEQIQITFGNVNLGHLFNKQWIQFF